MKIAIAKADLFLAPLAWLDAHAPAKVGSLGLSRDFCPGNSVNDAIGVYVRTEVPLPIKKLSSKINPIRPESYTTFTPSLAVRWA